LDFVHTFFFVENDKEEKQKVKRSRRNGKLRRNTKQPKIKNMREFYANVCTPEKREPPKKPTLEELCAEIGYDINGSMSEPETGSEGSEKEFEMMLQKVQKEVIDSFILYSFFFLCSYK